MNTTPTRTVPLKSPGRQVQVTTESVAGLDIVGASVASRSTYYQQICQLPTVLDSDSGQITVIAGRVQAVMVPWALGRRVRSELSRSGAGYGPIVSHPKSGSWTFITNSDRKLDPATDDIVFWLGNVVVLASGVPIALPTPTATNAAPFREWELPPTSPQRPTTFAVLVAIRTCLRRGGTR